MMFFHNDSAQRQILEVFVSYFISKLNKFIAFRSNVSDAHKEEICVDPTFKINNFRTKISR